MPGILCPPQFHADTEKLERALQGGHQDDKGVEKLCEERFGVLGLFSLEKRSLGEDQSVFQYLKGIYGKDG